MNQRFYSATRLMEVAMRRLLIPLLFAVTPFPASASNPGEPLDCSDWVFLEPGLSCTDFHVISRCSASGGV